MATRALGRHLGQSHLKSEELVAELIGCCGGHALSFEDERWESIELADIQGCSANGGHVQVGVSFAQA